MTAETIRILVDADGCPVKQEVFKVAERYGLTTVLVANHWLNAPAGPKIERVVVDEFDNRFAEITVDTQLGLGERRVVVPLADLTWHEDIAAFLTTAEQDELDDLPESDDAFRPLPR